MLALRALARRQLSVEIDELDALIGPLVTAINPTLIGLSGVAPTSPASCWSPPGTTPSGSATRRRSAMLCGAAPLPASSGQLPGTTHRREHELVAQLETGAGLPGSRWAVIASDIGSTLRI
jgi:hypothetical protein